MRIDRRRKAVLVTLITLTVLLAVVIGVTVGIAVASVRNIGEIGRSSETESALPSVLLDRNGRVITELFAEEKRTIVSIENLPRHLIHALVTREDQSFFEHGGFSVWNITRAAVNLGLNFVTGGVSLKDTAIFFEELRATEIDPFDRDLRVMKICVSAAPLLGLLGTVTGMIKAFENIAQSGAGNPNLVASGIAEALTTTAAGLIVAIPTLAAYHFFRGKIDRLVYEMEEIATTLLTGLQEKKPASADEEMSHAVPQSR